MVDQIWLYALADAQRNTGVAVHLSTRMRSQGDPASGGGPPSGPAKLR